MKLVRYKYNKLEDGKGRLDIFPVPSEYLDKNDKPKKIKHDFRKRLGAYFAANHPLQTRIQKSTGLVRCELSTKNFGFATTMLGDMPVDYKKGKWSVDGDKVIFAANGYEIWYQLIGLGLKQTIKITDTSLLGDIREALLINREECAIHKTNRATAQFDNMLQESTRTPIMLLEDGTTVGQIEPAVAYNNEYSIELGYSLVTKGDATALVIHIPDEVYDWDGPIYIDPSPSIGFTKNFGTCEAALAGLSITYTDKQHPNAVSHITSPPPTWTGGYSEQLYYTNNSAFRVGYFDVFLPNNLKAIVRHAKRMQVQMVTDAGYYGDEIQCALLPFRMRPVDGTYYLTSNAFTRGSGTYKNRTGANPMIISNIVDMIKNGEIPSVPLINDFYFGNSADIFNTEAVITQEKTLTYGRHNLQRISANTLRITNNWYPTYPTWSLNGYKISFNGITKTITSWNSNAGGSYVDCTLDSDFTLSTGTYSYRLFQSWDYEKRGGRAQEIFHDFINSDREDRISCFIMPWKGHYQRTVAGDGAVGNTSLYLGGDAGYFVGGDKFVLDKAKDSTVYTVSSNGSGYIYFSPSLTEPVPTGNKIYRLSDAQFRISTSDMLVSLYFDSPYGQNVQDMDHLGAGEPSICFAEDDETVGKLYVALGISTRDMRTSDESLEPEYSTGNTDSKRDPLQLDQRAHVRDDYAYSDPQERPFNHVPGSCFMRDLSWIYRNDVTLASSDDIAFPSRKALRKKSLRITNNSPTTHAMYSYFDSPPSTYGYNITMIPLHPMEFGKPYYAQLWAKSTSNNWKAMIVHGYNFDTGKWMFTELKDESENSIAYGNDWTYNYAEFTPNYTAPWGYSRDIASKIFSSSNTQMRTWRSQDLLGEGGWSPSNDGTYYRMNPYGCFLVLYSQSSSASDLYIYSPSVIQTHNAFITALPEEAEPEEIEFPEGDEYYQILADKNRVTQIHFRSNDSPLINSSTNFRSTMNVISGPTLGLPYLTSSETASRMLPAGGGDTYQLDMEQGLGDEGSIEFWYAPYENPRYASSKVVSNLHRYNTNGQMVPAVADTQDSYEDGSNVFDTNLSHIFSIGNLSAPTNSSFSTYNIFALSGLGMSLVRCGNSLIWMVRNTGFIGINNPYELFGQSNSLQDTRAQDKAFYKCQFDIPESMLFGYNLAFSQSSNRSTQCGWMHVRLTWGARMEMYVNGELVDTTPHQGLFSDIPVPHSSFSGHLARTGEADKLVVGAMALAYKTTASDSNATATMLYESYSSTRGWYYTLQADSCFIQDFGISNQPVTTVHSATRSDDANDVGQTGNTHEVSSGAVTNAVNYDSGSVVFETQGIGTYASYLFNANDFPHYGGIIEAMLECTAEMINDVNVDNIYLRGKMRSDGKLEFDAYTCSGYNIGARLQNNTPLVYDYDGETLDIVVPYGRITYAGYIPPTVDHVYIQRPDGAQATISNIVSRTPTTGSSLFSGTYSCTPFGDGKTVRINANIDSQANEGRFNGKRVNISGFGWTTIRNWHVLRNGHVIATLESTLPNIDIATNLTFTIYETTWSCTFDIESTNLFGLEYNLKDGTSSSIVGSSISVYSCDIADRGISAATGNSGEAWLVSDKLHIKTPYAESRTDYGKYGDCQIWYDGNWHFCHNGTTSGAGVQIYVLSGSFSLLEYRGTAPVQGTFDGITTWNVTADTHAIFSSSPGSQFKVARYALSSSYYGYTLNMLHGTHRHVQPAGTVDSSLKMCMPMDTVNADSILPSVQTPAKLYSISPSVIAGVFGGNALNLAGSYGGQDKSCYQFASNNIPATGSFTVAFWFKKDNGAQAIPPYHAYYDPVSWVQSRNGFYAIERGFAITTYQDGGCYVSLGDGTNSASGFAINRDAEGGPNINTNTWRHLCIVFDRSTNYIRTYLDGVQYNSIQTASVTGDVSTGRYVWVGGTPNESQSFRGGMDQVMIFSKALSSSERLALRQEGIPSFVTNLYSNDDALFLTTPKDIIRCAGAKNTMVFEAKNGGNMDFLSYDIPTETDKWIFEGRTREKDCARQPDSGSHKMEFGSFAAIVSSSTPTEYSRGDFDTYNQAGAVYYQTRGIAATFHTSERYAGTPAPGGHYNQHLMPLYSVLTGMESTHNYSTSPDGPDAGTDIVLNNANRWCQFPFHYKTIKGTMGWTGDDLADDDRRFRFYGTTRSSTYGLLRVSLRVLGSRYLHSGEAPEQIESHFNSKFYRAACVGEPAAAHHRTIPSRILDHDNNLTMDLAPQIWFDGRWWHMRHGGSNERLYHNGSSSYYPIVGAFTFRSLYAFTNDGFGQFGPAFHIDALRGLGDDYALINQKYDGSLSSGSSHTTHPSARMSIEVVNYSVTAADGLSGNNGYRMITYPGLGGSVMPTDLNLRHARAGIGGPAYDLANWGTDRFELKSYKSSNETWSDFYGHVKFRIADGSTYDPYRPAHKMYKSISMYQPYVIGDMPNTILLGHEALFIDESYHMKDGGGSPFNTTRIINERAYNYEDAGSGATQWWSPVLPQPESYEIEWDFTKDLALFNGRRVKMIATATQGRRHWGRFQNAPTWSISNNLQRAIEGGPSANLEHAPASAFMRKADEEHMFRYPEDYYLNGSVYQFKLNNLVGFGENLRLVTDGSSYVTSIKTSAQAILSQVNMYMYGDAGNPRGDSYQYKTISRGETRTLTTLLSNNGSAPATIAIGAAVLRFKTGPGGATYMTAYNNSEVTIAALDSEELTFPNVDIAASDPLGAIYAELEVTPDGESASTIVITDANTMYIQESADKNIILYRHDSGGNTSEDRNNTIFFIGGDRFRYVDDLGVTHDVSVFDNLHPVAYTNYPFRQALLADKFDDNTDSLQSNAHIMRYITKGHPNPRWDMRVTKRNRTDFAGTNYAYQADIDAIIQGSSSLKAYRSNVLQTTYSIHDFISFAALNEEADDPHQATYSRSADDIKLTNDKLFARVVAYNWGVYNISHQGGQFQLSFLAWVNGKQYTITSASEANTSGYLIEIPEQDPPSFSNPSVACEEYPTSGDYIYIEENTLQNWWFAWDCASGNRAWFKPRGRLLIGYNPFVELYEFVPDGDPVTSYRYKAADTHIYDDFSHSFESDNSDPDNPNNDFYVAPGKHIQMRFSGRFVDTSNMDANRFYKFHFMDHDETVDANGNPVTDAWKSNRDTNMCPYLGTRVLYNSTPYIKIIGKAVIAGDSIEQRSSDSVGDAQLYYTTSTNQTLQAAGCVRVQFDVSAPGPAGQEYNADFMILVKKPGDANFTRRPYLRSNGEAGGVATVDGSPLTIENGVWTETWNVGGVQKLPKDSWDLENGAPAHFTTPIGNSNKTIKVDIDLKHQGYWDQDWLDAEDQLEVQIVVRRTAPTEALTYHTVGNTITYYGGRPKSLTVSVVEGETYNYDIRMVKLQGRSLTHFDDSINGSRNMPANLGGFQYAIGGETGSWRRTWHNLGEPAPAPGTVSFEVPASQKWYSILFRGHDKWGNYATYLLQRPYDATVPSFSPYSGFRMLPQYGDDARYNLDIESGSTNVYVSFPPTPDITHAMWRMTYNPGTGDISRDYNYPTRRWIGGIGRWIPQQQTFPVSKIMNNNPFMPISINFYNIHQQINDPDPDTSINSFWYQGESGGGVTGGLTTDSDLGVEVLEATTQPRGEGYATRLILGTNLSLFSADRQWGVRNNSIRPTMPSVGTQLCRYVYLILKVSTDLSGRSIPAETQPQWKARLQFQNTGDSNIYNQDFYVYDDNLWHKYRIYVGNGAWGATDTIEKLQVVFGADYADDNGETGYTDAGNGLFYNFWTHTIGNQDNAPHTKNAQMTASLAFMGLGFYSDMSEYLVPMTLSSALNGDDAITMKATLYDFNYNASTYVDPNTYYIVPKTPTSPSVRHKNSTDGMLRFEVYDINTSETATGVQYYVEYWSTVNGTHQPVVGTGGQTWFSEADWQSGLFGAEMQEGETYYFRCKGRNPNNVGTETGWSNTVSLYSDFIRPQIVRCSHFSDAVHNYYPRTGNAPTGGNEFKNISSAAQVGNNMEDAWKQSSAGWCYKGDWNDGFYPGINQSTLYDVYQFIGDKRVMVEMRNFMGCATNVIESPGDPAGNTLSTHPVDGYFYKVTHGESTRETHATSGDSFIEAPTNVDNTYKVLRITLNSSEVAPLDPVNGVYLYNIAYVHIRPFYKSGANRIAFSTEYEAHVAIYLDKNDNKHPTATKILAAQADGINTDWNSITNESDFDGNIYKLKGTVTPAYSIPVVDERAQYNRYALDAQAVTDGAIIHGDFDYSTWSIYTGGIASEYLAYMDGLAEHKRYRVRYKVNSSSGLTGPVSDWTDFEVFTNIRPLVENVVNVYPSGDHHIFEWNGMWDQEKGDYNASEIAASGVNGHYEIYDWMNAETVATVPFSEGAYSEPVALSAGEQGAFVIKSYNDDGITFDAYTKTSSENDWDDKPLKRTFAEGGWKPAVYDYTTTPLAEDMTVAIGYFGTGKFFKVIPRLSVNVNTARKMWYDLSAGHDILNNSITSKNTDTNQTLTEYLIKVYWRWKSAPDTEYFMGYMTNTGGTVNASYNENYWLTYADIKADDYRPLQYEPGFIGLSINKDYGFAICARTKNAVEVEEDLTETNWYISPWSATKWTDLSARADDESGRYLHMYCRNAGGGQWTFESATIVQDVDPAGLPGSIFRDVRLSYKQIGAETTDLDLYPEHIKNWIENDAVLGVNNDGTYYPGYLYSYPTTLSRLYVEVTFLDDSENEVVLQRAVDLFNTGAKHGESGTGWGVHDKDDVVSIHSDYGIARFNVFQQEIEDLTGDGYISKQEVDTWYHMSWNLYDDILSGNDTTFGSTGLEAYNKTWDDVTNVRMQLATFAFSASGIYTDISQPEATEWRNDYDTCRPLEIGHAGLLVRNLSIGWKEQVDVLGAAAYNDDAWNGSYEWRVQPINIQHNPELDAYEEYLNEQGLKAGTSKPKEFIYKKSIPQPSETYTYNSYVKEILED